MMITLVLIIRNKINSLYTKEGLTQAISSLEINKNNNKNILRVMSHSLK